MDDPCAIDPMSDACLNPPVDPPGDDPCVIDPMSDPCLNPPVDDPCAIDPFSDACLGPPIDPADLGDLGPDELGDLDPGSLGGFTDDHIANLTPDAAGGFNMDQLGNLPPDVFDQFTPDQIGNLDPFALAGLSPDQLGNLDPTAIGGFTPDQIDELTPDAVGGFTPEQFQSLPPDALMGFDEQNLGGLDPDVIQGIELEDLNNLDPMAIQNLPGNDLAEFLTNLGDPSIAPDDVTDLLPEGWEIDPSTGDLQAPPGAELAFPSLDQLMIEDGTTLPELPDFSRDLSLGGAMTGDTVLMGLDMALGAAGFDEFSFSQEMNGILNVAPDADPTAIAAAFIPDTDSMVQAPDGTPPGIGMNEEGAFVLTTDDGFQIPLLPAPADPNAIVNLLPGTEVQVGSEGETVITNPGDGGGPIVGVFDPLLTESDQAPGLYRMGDGPDEEILIVYEDGTAQMLNPTIQSPDEFNQAAQGIPGVENIEINTDGTIDLTFEGNPLTLQPLFDVEQGTGTGQQTPMLMAEGDRFFFTNSNGDRQEFVLGT